MVPPLQHRNSPLRHSRQLICLTLWVGAVFVIGLFQYNIKDDMIPQPAFSASLVSKDITTTDSSAVLSTNLSSYHNMSATFASGRPFFKLCQPITNIMFLKTHKTAGSTILNILFRFSEKHNLTVALPYDSHVHLGYPNLFNAAFVEEFQTIGQRFNVMGNHLRFNLPEVRRVMPNTTFYFSILKDPASLLESSYAYYKHITPAFRNSKNIYAFLSSPSSYYKRYQQTENIYAKNIMWFDLGYDNNAVYDDNYVQSVIKDVEQNFQLMLIAEYFDESMILLKNMLCWDLDDVVYFKMNARSLDSLWTLNKEGREKAKEWCALDWELYKHFNRTFWIAIQKTMSLKSLYEEVAHLQRRQEELMEMCLLEKTAIDANEIINKRLQPFQSGQAKILGYNLKPDLDNKTQNFCQKMIMPELQQTAYLYSRQFPNKKTHRFLK